MYLIERKSLVNVYYENKRMIFYALKAYWFHMRPLWLRYHFWFPSPKIKFSSRHRQAFTKWSRLEKFIKVVSYSFLNEYPPSKITFGFRWFAKSQWRSAFTQKGHFLNPKLQWSHGRLLSYLLICFLLGLDVWGNTHVLCRASGEERTRPNSSCRGWPESQTGRAA